MSYLLDTNLVSEAMKATPHPGVTEWLDRHGEEIHLSAVTIGEIEQGLAWLPSGRRKEGLRTLFAELMQTLEGRVLPFDTAVARRWAELTATSQRKGRTLPILDSMIEATALHWDFTVVTRNTGDFVEAKTLNLWE